jgi:hypothetical protein
MRFALGQNPSASSHNKLTDFRQLYNSLLSCSSLILALFFINTIIPTQGHVSTSSTHSHSDAQCNHIHPKLNDVSKPQTN